MSNRRSFIKTLSLAGISLGLLKPTSASFADRFVKGGFSFLHLTDMHVRRKRQCHLGYQACVDAVNKYNRASDFVLMGGDLAFDLSSQVSWTKMRERPHHGKGPERA